MNEPPPASWEAIYREYRGALFATAYSILSCDQTAEDAIHEAFAAIYRTAQSPRDPVAYVFSAVRNSALDHARRTKRSKRVHETIFNGQVPPPRVGNPSANELILDRERDQILRRAIDRLEADQREVVILRTFAELTFEQIAEITSTSAKTLASRYHRALGKLEMHLKGKL